MSQPLYDERPRVLIVDDEKFIRDILADFLGMEGYVVRTPKTAQPPSPTHCCPVHMVISDLKMPRMGGIELLDAIATTAPNALTVIMTGFGTVETAIDAMKRGAYDYILKPFKWRRSFTSCSAAREAALVRREFATSRGAQPLQGERGHRGESLARRSARHLERDCAPRDSRRSRLRVARRRQHLSL